MSAEATSLRSRIVAAHALLAVAVCGLFASVSFIGIEQIEAFVVHRRLDLIVQWEIERPAGTPAAPLPPGIRYFGPEALSPAMRALTPGFHQESVGEIMVHTLVVDAAGGRHVAVDRVPDFELIERDVALALAAGTAVSVLLAALLGRLTAGRVIAPLSELIVAVEEDQLRADAPALARADEIGRLGRAFSARTAQLRGFLEREQAFSGDASHELRTPITVIAGAAELLAVQLADRPALLPAVERIQRTAAEMTDRVAALLLLSHAPEAIPTPVIELRAVVEREVQHCRPLVGGKPVQIVFDAPAPVQLPAHAELASVAVGNLLRNACAYTEAGRITVALRADGLVIEDTGPGLPDEVRSRLFVRLDPAEREAGGSGFGLALVKRICDRLGWSIRYESGVPAGSRFVIGFR